MGPVQIQELLQKCISLSQHKLELQNIALTTSFQPNLPAVQGDANQLQQCIINLIFNAIDAMSEGGNLHIKSHHDADKTHVLIAISDTGAGIPENNLPHIFEPFFTTKQEGYGVGLGLSTVYGIIEHHNGQIDVKSRLEKGTTFFIRLPVIPVDSS